MVDIAYILSFWSGNEKFFPVGESPVTIFPDFGLSLKVKLQNAINQNMEKSGEGRQLDGEIFRGQGPNNLVNMVG